MANSFSLLFYLRKLREYTNTVRNEVRDEIDGMYRQVINLFQAINCSKLENRFCKKLVIAKYLDKEIILARN